MTSIIKLIHENSTVGGVVASGHIIKLPMGQNPKGMPTRILASKMTVVEIMR